MDNASGSALVVGVIALFSLGGWYAYTVWSECLGQHSFLFCAAVLGGK